MSSFSLPNFPRQVACPQCGRSAPWNPQNPWRPFCSERCKMIDLGCWASERYRVPEIEANDGGETENGI